MGKNHSKAKADFWAKKTPAERSAEMSRIAKIRHSYETGAQRKKLGKHLASARKKARTA